MIQSCIGAASVFPAKAGIQGTIPPDRFCLRCGLHLIIVQSDVWPCFKEIDTVQALLDSGLRRNDGVLD